MFAWVKHRGTKNTTKTLTVRFKRPQNLSLFSLFLHVLTLGSDAKTITMRKLLIQIQVQTLCHDIHFSCSSSRCFYILIRAHQGCIQLTGPDWDRHTSVLMLEEYHQVKKNIFRAQRPVGGRDPENIKTKKCTAPKTSRNLKWKGFGKPKSLPRAFLSSKREKVLR